MRGKRRTSLKPLAVMFWLLTFLALFLLPGQAVLADTYVSGNITSNTTWNLAGSPYIVTGNVYIGNATLTIDPGVEVRFNPNTSLKVGHYGTGTLIADGTEGNEILFTGDSENPWYYINFTNETGAGTSLSHAIIENGGSAGNSLVRVQDSDVTIQNCTIQNSAGTGLQIELNALPTLANNRYVGNNSYPIYVGSSSTLSISAVDNTSTFPGNGDNRVYYYGGTIGSDTSIADPGIPYRVDNVVYIGNATLTIDPGVELQFDPNTFLKVGHYGTGTLIADGTEGNEILFTGNSDNPWYYIIFTNETGAGTSLSHAIIENGGSAGNSLVRVQDSDVTIQNCTIQNSAGTGLRIELDALPTLANNRYVGNNSYPIYVSGALSVSAVDNTSTFSGNGDNRVYYYGGTIGYGIDTSIADPGIPYRVDNVVYISGVTLTIDPGVELQFDHKTFLKVGHYGTGTLIADGTEGNEILFTGNSEDPWYYIIFTNETGAGTSLSHAIIENGGSGGNPLIYVYDSDVTIQNCTIQNSAGTGLRIESNVLPTLANNNYVGNSSYPIYVNGALSVSAVDNTSTFSGNGDNRVYYYGSTIGHDTSIADPGIPYSVDNVVYIGSATLTIYPGVELQFDPNTFLKVGHYGTGTLIADGTDEANIKFTSGEETPAPGDWHGVYFSDLTGDGSILKSAIVEYGGQDNWGSVYVNNSSPTIRECTIRHSLNFGVTVVNPSAYPELYCNTITANNIGIHVEGNANPTIHDNDIRGNTTYGVQNINSSQVVDAMYNYWGAADGPSGEGSGTGDAITENVLYDPFLMESAPCTVPLNADFAAAPTEGCEELTVNFTDGSTGDVIAWEWDFGDGSSSNEQNPVHTYTEPGTYTVTLTVYDTSEDSDTVSQDIIVTESVPTADFHGNPPLAGEWPLTVNFHDDSTICGTDPITGWEWNFGDGSPVSNDPEPSYTYNNAGQFTVSLTVTDSDGDQDTMTKEDYVYVSDEAPVADPNGPYTGTEGQAIPFDGSASYDPNGGELTCDWDFGDGSAHSSAMNPSHVYAQDSEEQSDGVYTVILTVYDEAGQPGSSTTTVEVADIDPEADFTADVTSGTVPLTVQFTDLTSTHDGIVSWTWGFGDTQGSSDPNPEHTYTEAGTYTVTLTVTEEDGDTDVEKKVAYIEVTGECTTYYCDEDQDGYGTDDSECIYGEPSSPYTAIVSGDCDDTDAAVNPGAEEVCDGVDNNCNGEVDEGVTTTFYQDADSDGYGNPDVTIQACVAPDGYVDDNTDCDDTRTDVHPGAEELCDGVDNNCNGEIDEGCGCEINEIPGDLDGDCDVDGADRNILRASLRKCEGDEGYNADADYDGDGCITFGDYRIWYGHYKAFQSGAG